MSTLVADHPHRRKKRKFGTEKTLNRHWNIRMHLELRVGVPLLNTGRILKIGPLLLFSELL
jgi:hypothetical protein